MYNHHGSYKFVYNYQNKSNYAFKVSELCNKFLNHKREKLGS